MTKEELDSLKDEVMRYANGCWDSILAALAPQLQPALEKGGRRHVPCPVHGGKDGFRVFQDVADTGGCVCNTCGVRSDGIATLMWVNGWRYSSTVKAVAEYLRVGNASVKPARRPPPAPKKKADTAEDDERMRQNLNRVWNATIPISDRDAEPARLYLARRGISIRPPETLRFHPDLGYYEDGKLIGSFPAITAMAHGPDNTPVTIYRLYLTADGHKAPVESPKKLMSHPESRVLTGGAIRLIEASTVLAVAEGPETALAVLEGTDLPVWCAINAYLLENFVPPSGVQQVVIFADKDRSTKQHPKGHGQEAAKALVQRLWAMDIKASAIVPPGEIPTDQKSLDWLDILNRYGKAGFPTLQSVEDAKRRAA